MQYKISLKAGIEQRQQFQGTTMVVLSTGVAPTIDMVVELQGYAVEELRAIKAGLRMRSPGFTGAKFIAPVDCEIEVIVSAADISVNYTEGATVKAQIIGTVPVSAPAPLAVVPDRGAPGQPVYVSGITYSDAPAVTLTDRAAVPVTDAGAALVPANASRRGLRFTNIGVDPVAIGFTGLTWAKRCLILAGGDSWVEERAANLAWYAITDAAKTASITIQEVIA